MYIFPSVVVLAVLFEMRFVVAIMFLAVATMAEPEPRLNLAGGLTASLGGQFGLLDGLLGGQGGLLSGISGGQSGLLGTGVLGGQGGGVGLLQGLLGSNGPVGGLVSGILGPIIGGVLGSGGGLLGGGVGNVDGAAGDLLACLLSAVLEDAASVLDQVLSPLLGLIGGLRIQVPPIIAPTTPRETCTVGKTAYNEGDYYDECFQCTEDGFTDSSGLVTDVNNPTQDTCCPQADDGYCLVAICGLESVLERCEASALCLSRGYQLAGREWFVNRDVYGQPWEIGANSGYFALNIKVGNDSRYEWMPRIGPSQNVLDDMELASEPDENEFCSEATITEAGADLEPLRCGAVSCACAICFDPDTNLPPCE